MIMGSEKYLNGDVVALELLKFKMNGDVSLIQIKNFSQIRCC